tara:strand:+ start:575 stop:715 length:141 start_codon:yes stop_codon:yes gene_type:complete
MASCQRVTFARVRSFLKASSDKLQAPSRKLQAASLTDGLIQVIVGE